MQYQIDILVLKLQFYNNQDNKYILIYHTLKSLTLALINYIFLTS